MPRIRLILATVVLAGCTAALIVGAFGATATSALGHRTSRKTVVAAAKTGSGRVPAAVLASSLVAAAKLSTALHTTLGAIQDDGGATSSVTPGFTSQAEVATKLTALTVTLTSYPSQRGAARGYALLTGSGSHRVPGLGQAGSTQSDGTAIVLSSHQLLVVRPVLTVAGASYVAAAGKSPQSLQIALYGPALAAARALARHMSGRAPAGQSFYLPPGALYPCIGTAAELHKETHKAVTVQPVMTMSPPAQQCDFTIAGMPFLTTTYTSAQARSAISAGSPQAIFAADLRNAAGRRIQQVTDGPIKAFMVEDTDWHVDFLIHGYVAARAASANRGNGPAATLASPAGDALVETRNGYTFAVSYDDCLTTLLDEVTRVLDPALAAGGPNEHYNRMLLLIDVHEWCRALAGR